MTKYRVNRPFQVFVFLLLSSCTKEVKLPETNAKPKLVVETQLTNFPTHFYSDSISNFDSTYVQPLIPYSFIQLGRSSSIQDSPMESVSDAVLKLYKNGTFKKELTYDVENGYYSIYNSQENSEMPIANDELELEINYQGKSWNLQTTLPEDIHIDHLDTNLFLGYKEGQGITSGGSIRFYDDPNQTNFYELVVISGKSNGRYNYFKIQTKDPVIVGEPHYPSVVNLTNAEAKNQSLLFQDSSFNGTLKTVDFTYIFPRHIPSFPYEFQTTTVYFELRNVSEKYYRLKSAQRTYQLKNNFDIITGPTEPINVEEVENVLHGGFTSYNLDQHAVIFYKRMIQE